MPIPTVPLSRAAFVMTAVVVLGACRGGTPEMLSTTSSSTTASAATTALPTSTLAPTTSTSTTTTTSTTLPPTTTTEPLVVDGAVVMVANAADVPGAAATLTADLAAIGFSMKEPANGAIYDTIIETTKVYARQEAQAVAASVARVLGGVPVERMPTPAPISGANESLGDASVLVMLGRDLAGIPLPG